MTKVIRVSALKEKDGGIQIRVSTGHHFKAGISFSTLKSGDVRQWRWHVAATGDSNPARRGTITNVTQWHLIAESFFRANYVRDAVYGIIIECIFKKKKKENPYDLHLYTRSSDASLMEMDWKGFYLNNAVL